MRACWHAGTNGHRIHYTHDRGSMLPVHKDIISRGEGGGAE